MNQDEINIALAAFQDGINDCKSGKKLIPCRGENFRKMAKDFRSSNIYSISYQKGYFKELHAS